MDVILTKDAVAQATPSRAIQKEATANIKADKFEFIKGCWFITKKLFSFN